MGEALATKVVLEKTEATLRGENRELEQRTTIRLPSKPLRPRAFHVAQDVEDGLGEGGITLRAPAQVDDRVIIPDGSERLDHLLRWVSREFGNQRVPGIATAPVAHRDRRCPADRSRRIDQTTTKQQGRNPGLQRKRKRWLARTFRRADKL